jgi:hypothetical protein
MAGAHNSSEPITSLPWDFYKLQINEEQQALQLLMVTAMEKTEVYNGR